MCVVNVKHPQSVSICVVEFNQFYLYTVEHPQKCYSTNNFTICKKKELNHIEQKPKASKFSTAHYKKEKVNIYFISKLKCTQSITFYRSVFEVF